MSDRAMAAGIRWATSVTEINLLFLGDLIQAATSDLANLVFQAGNRPGVKLWEITLRNGAWRGGSVTSTENGGS